MIKQIGQIGVPVQNIERAISFYRDKLNLPLLFNTDRMAFFMSGDIRIMLTLPEKEQFDHPSSILYFSVENISEAYDYYIEQGVEFVDTPHMVAKVGHTENWMAFFNDTEGNMHGLMCEVQVEVDMTK